MATYAYRFPELGEGIHEGEIVKLLIKSGDVVNDETILMEVQNDKAVVEVPCPVAGKVIHIFVSEGQLCTVGQVVAELEVEGNYALEEHHPTAHETPDATRSVQASQVSQVSQVAQVAQNVHSSQEGAEEPSIILATPSVRKLAREQGVQLRLVRPSGKHGHVTREDVLQFAKPSSSKSGAHTSANDWLADETPQIAKQSTPVASLQQHMAASRVTSHENSEERIPFKGIRKIIANAMTKSMYTAPHVTLMDEVEVSALVALREKAKPFAVQKGVKLTYLPFVVKALTAGCRQYPVMNAMIDEEKQEIVYKKYYHLGIATDTDNGLLVPVMMHADQLSVWSIAAAIQDLAKRAREGKLAPQELRGSTITITNIGSVGGMFFTPIINYPEVAILGVGRITEKPIVKDGQVAVGSMMALSLSFDHRLVDGATAQAFLNVVKSYLADPALLILEV